MSDDDYVRHIAQKYRLAISIAVIASKPENLSLENYVEQLRNSLNNDEIDSEDLNISICSEDFNIDQIDDFDFDENNDDIVRNIIISDSIHNVNYQNNVSINTNNVKVTDTQNLDESDMNSDQNTCKFGDNQTTHDKIVVTGYQNDVDMICTQDSSNSVTVLNQFDEINTNITDTNTGVEQRSSLKDVLEILKGIDENMTSIDEALTNKTSPSTYHNLAQESDNIDITQCFTIDNENLRESLDLLPNVDMHLLSREHNYSMNDNNIPSSRPNDGHVDINKQVQKHADVNIVDPKVNNNNKNKNQYIARKREDAVSVCNKEANSKDPIIDKDELKPESTIRGYRHTKHFQNIYKNMADIFDTTTKIIIHENIKDQQSADKLKSVTNKNKSSKVSEGSSNNLKSFILENDEIDCLNKIPKDSQETFVYTIPEDFSCTSRSHYSESQVNTIVIIDEKYIHGTISKNKKQDLKESTKMSQSNKNKHENDDIKNKSHITEPNFTKPSTSNSQDAKYNIILDNTRNNMENVDKYAGQAIDLDKDVFSQEIQQNNFLTSIDSIQVCDKNNEKFIKTDKALDNIQNKNQCTKDDKICNSKIIYLDNDLFTQESQLTNFSQISTNYGQGCSQISTNYGQGCSYISTNYGQGCSQISTNYGQDLTGNGFEFQHDAQNMDEDFQMQLHNKNQIDKPFSKSCTVLDKNSDRRADQVTKRDGKLGNRETTGAQTIPHQAISKHKNENKDNCDTGTQVQDSMQIEHTKTVPKYEEKLKNAVPYQAFPKHKNENKDNCDTGTQVQDSMQIEHTKTVPKYEEKLKNAVTKQTDIDDNLEHMDVEEDLQESQIELVPFKIIEELNKVKMYLNRRNEKINNIDGCSNDTGYKSDSQSRTSWRSSQSSSGWLNQSAFSLFNYISECPLVVTTTDITYEISIVLGQLIDKLHEEEQYPSFLEELLEMVQLLLAIVYEDNSGDNLLMKKDEAIQRILLLNKSTHIQQFTIEKITCILDNLYTEISIKDSLYEIKNVDQIENACYIFHILEIILNRYNKTSENLSQSLSHKSSQEDKNLKKSHISDIWRKKWNPNPIEKKIEGSQENQCVVTNCSSILNKLIVNCMDGYSLISYYALKCFNLMQN